MMKKHTLTKHVSFSLSALALSLSVATSAQAATYSVVELPAEALGVNVFAQALDEQGNAAVVVQDQYQPPLNLSLVNFESATVIEALTDLDAAQAGNPNFDDYNYLVAVARSASRENSLFFQQIALYQSHLVNGQTTTRAIAFDVETDETDGFTFSADTYVNAMLSDTVFVGTAEAPFYTSTYVNSEDVSTNFVVSDFDRRAFATVGTSTTPLIPVDATLGGVSEANDINDNLLVAGHQTIAVSNQFQVLIDNCNDETERGERTLEACYRDILRNNALANNNFRQATVWQLDSAGAVVEQINFPYPFTFEREEEGNERIHFSNARAVNNAGIAVGETVFQRDGDFVRGTAAAVFRDGQTATFLDGENEAPSVAFDINENNLITGYYSQVVNGNMRTKVFVHDLDADTTHFPQDFFPGSASLGRDINNNGIVVGEGEVEASTISTRRRHGFMYDTSTQTFTDLNDALGCESPYLIVSAQAINDDNVILANALVNRQARNVVGELVTDTAGEPVMVDRVVPVLLEPLSGGALEDCGDDTSIVTERQGASWGLWSLLLLGIAGIRRCKFA
jgi:hypothetical protein